MSAILYWQEWNGTSGTESPTAKSADDVRFKRADDATPDANDKLIVPSGGVFRSFEKYLRLYLADLGGLTSVSNLNIFTTDEAPDDGLSVWAKAEAAYDTPLMGGYDASGAMAGAKANLFSYTSDSPLDLGAGPFGAPGDIGSFLVLQMEVLPVADVTAAPNYSLVVRYDEEE